MDEPDMPTNLENCSSIGCEECPLTTLDPDLGRHSKNEANVLAVRL
ncbi:unnamed protein product [Gongylonema pulchrum]|uniref:Uncharacterized protein n=1 Tax=Gongylonema pulchrum TaxID=637853 RepID=A0A3P6Q3E9_9BILA|nr:unnamed protein product [Gongylonema pulchrum]